MSSSAYDLGRGLWVVDGGLATEIERRGHVIQNDPLWSARLLHTNSSLIRNIHRTFLNHGADIIITASYQASVDGFVKHLGVSPDEALDLIGQSVTMATQARKEYLQDSGQRRRPLIAGSVGPYGACLCDGSEYHGNYVDHMSLQELADWHRPRVSKLLESGVDVLAFETIPAKKEAEALLQLLGEFPSAKALLTYSCKDGSCCCHGDLFRDAISLCNSQVVAVGINCTHPSFVEPLLKSAVGCTNLPFIVYPNSGEEWTCDKGWLPEGGRSLVSYLPKWVELGAKIVGGCCRVTPEEIGQIRQTFDKMNNDCV